MVTTPSKITDEVDNDNITDLYPVPYHLLNNLLRGCVRILDRELARKIRGTTYRGLHL